MVKFSNGTLLHSSDCISSNSYYFTSVNFEKQAVSKSVACQTDLCNSPSIIKVSENTTLCSDGFYDNTNVTLPPTATMYPTTTSYYWWPNTTYSSNPTIKCYSSYYNVYDGYAYNSSTVQDCYDTNYCSSYFSVDKIHFINSFLI